MSPFGSVRIHKHTLSLSTSLIVCTLQTLHHATITLLFPFLLLPSTAIPSSPAAPLPCEAKHSSSLCVCTCAWLVARWMGFASTSIQWAITFAGWLAFFVSLSFVLPLFYQIYLISPTRHFGPSHHFNLIQSHGHHHFCLSLFFFLFFSLLSFFLSFFLSFCLNKSAELAAVFFLLFLSFYFSILPPIPTHLPSLQYHFFYFLSSFLSFFLRHTFRHSLALLFSFASCLAVYINASNLVHFPLIHLLTNFPSP